MPWSHVVQWLREKGLIPEAVPTLPLLEPEPVPEILPVPFTIPTPPEKEKMKETPAPEQQPKLKFRGERASAEPSP
jgi:hypothetical protein